MKIPAEVRVLVWCTNLWRVRGGRRSVSPGERGMVVIRDEGGSQDGPCLRKVVRWVRGVVGSSSSSLEDSKGVGAEDVCGCEVGGVGVGIVG
jgi:hypothetical protein